MSDLRILDVDEIRHMSVIDAGSGDKVGGVADVIVEPTGGRFIGIIVDSTDGDDSVLGLDAFRIGANAIMAAPGASRESRASSELMRRGVPAASKLVGVNVITEDGHLLGKISEVHVIVEQNLTIYRVSGSLLQRVFGGGFYIQGNHPVALSSDGVRLVVPADTETKHAATPI